MVGSSSGKGGDDELPPESPTPSGRRLELVKTEPPARMVEQIRETLDDLDAVGDTSGLLPSEPAAAREGYRRLHKHLGELLSTLDRIELQSWHAVDEALLLRLEQLALTRPHLEPTPEERAKYEAYCRAVDRAFGLSPDDESKQRRRQKR